MSLRGGACLQQLLFFLLFLFLLLGLGQHHVGLPRRHQWLREQPSRALGGNCLGLVWREAERHAAAGGDCHRKNSVDCDQDPLEELALNDQVTLRALAWLQKVSAADSACVVPAPNVHKDKQQNRHQHNKAVQHVRNIQQDLVVAPDCHLSHCRAHNVDRRNPETPPDGNLEVQGDVHSLS